MAGSRAMKNSSSAAFSAPQAFEMNQLFSCLSVLMRLQDALNTQILVLFLFQLQPWLVWFSHFSLWFLWDYLNVIIKSMKNWFFFFFKESLKLKKISFFFICILENEYWIIIILARPCCFSPLLSFKSDHSLFTNTTRRYFPRTGNKFYLHNYLDCHDILSSWILFKYKMHSRYVFHLLPSS